MAAFVKRLSAGYAPDTGPLARDTLEAVACFAAGNHYVEPEQAAPFNIVTHTTSSLAKVMRRK
jgi:hypothetical protein